MKYYICSSRLGLVRWYDRFRSNRRSQQVKAILDKVRYTNDIRLPHELLHGASAIHEQSSILVASACSLASRTGLVWLHSTGNLLPALRLKARLETSIFLCMASPGGTMSP